MNIPERKCVVCGKTYKPNSNVQKACGLECKKVLRQGYRKKDRAIKHELQARAKRLKHTDVAKIETAARKCGMTYGQWVAKQYVKSMSM